MSLKKRSLNMILFAGGVVALVVLSAFLGLTIKQDSMIREYIHLSAQRYFESILVTRRWSAQYGGVFVYKQPGMESNPYLENPDITAGDGRVYTKKNPALMTREISEMANAGSGYKYHITSLKCLNPQNSPDPWEREALEQFEKGLKEKTQITVEHGSKAYRLMRPLYFEESCVGCHGKQGYAIGDVRGGISVTLPYSEIEAALSSNRMNMLALAGGIIAIFILIFQQAIWKLVSRLSNVTEELENEKKQLEQLNAELDSKVEERTASLAEANQLLMKEMEERRNLEQQLLQAQKMEAIGTLAGGVAHDFNNILTAIIGYGNILQMKMNPDDPLRPNVDQVLEAAERAGNLTHSLLAFSRKQIVTFQPVDINDIIRTFEKFLKRIIREDINLRTVVHEKPLLVMADRGQIEQLLMNMVANARDAMQGGGTIIIKTGDAMLDSYYQLTHDYGEPGRFAMIVVEDNGTGMDKETAARIFEPFFTTKETGKGTGLGLAIVYGIVKQHKGTINVYSEPGHGTSFHIYIPLLTETVVEEQKIVKALPPPRGSETILYAEDDSWIRSLNVSVLKDFGYTVIEAIDGLDAVRKFRNAPDEIHILIMDMVMPKKSGSAAYAEINAIRPGIKVLFTSGYSDEMVKQGGALPEGAAFLNKPMSPKDLLCKIREVIDS